MFLSTGQMLYFMTSSKHLVTSVDYIPEIEITFKFPARATLVGKCYKLLSYATELHEVNGSCTML